MNLTEAKKTIKDLLNRAEDDASADLEIEAALKFARRLMLRHNISEEDLEDPQDPHEIAADTEYGQTDAFPFASRLTQFEINLGHAVCNLVGTVNWYRVSGSHTKKTRHGTVVFGDDGHPRKVISKCVFYGPVSDCNEAADLFEEWSTVIATMSRLKHGGFVRGSGRSYVEGFSMALYDKVKKINNDELRDLEANEGMTKDIVLLGQAREVMKAKKDRAEEWLKEEQGLTLTKGGRGKGQQDRDWNAYDQGRTDGDKADFSRREKAKTDRIWEVGITLTFISPVRCRGARTRKRTNGEIT